MEYRKNDVIELTVTDIGTEGEGIGKTGAFTWFIKDTVPGDRVTASVMKTKKTYGYARLIRVLEPGPDRVEPACPIARQCGGCTLQAMSYGAELAFKERRVRESLLRIGGISEETLSRVFRPIIGMEEPWRYRNKAQFPVGRDRDGNTVCGFYAGRTHSIVPCEDCLTGVKENRAVTEAVLGWMEGSGAEPYDETAGKGLVRHILVRKGFRSGEIMVCLVVNGTDVPDRKDLLSRLSEISGVRTVVLNVNRERTNVILGRETRVLSGPGYITDSIGDTRFRISAQSFYQVNPVQTEKLYGTALEYAGLTGNETVWDLYCGIGTISLFLAKKAKKVYGVEIVPQAIDDARVNAELNGIRNAEFTVGRAEEVLPRWYEREQERPEALRERIDVITVDPPRKGCDEACLSVILKLAPERIVYVSCDPATLARDLKILLAEGRYALSAVQPVDQFCRSTHVESCVLLERVSNRKADSYVKLNVKMADYYRIKDSAETENAEE